MTEDIRTTIIHQNCILGLTTLHNGEKLTLMKQTGKLSTQVGNFKMANFYALNTALKKPQCLSQYNSSKKNKKIQSSN